MMGSNEQRERGTDGGQGTAVQFTGAAVTGEGPAWEEIDAGRFMPRRIKGSFKGRALG